MMTVLGLLRHGEVEGGNCFRGHTDDPLSAIGLKQMWASTGDIQTWDCVISSPLKRCAEFASGFARHHSIPLELNDDLMEMNFGEWEGRTAAELMDDTPELLTNFWDNPDQHPPPGGETLYKVEARVLNARDSMIDRFTEQRILVVTHGGVIRILLCHARQKPIGKLLDIEVGHGTLHSLHASRDANNISWVESSTQP